ncbi:hypothetical protein LCGC14_2995600 [marine sediment metagenome]|uniref:Uncharacterized protein n=1 Tax=marine sediment metagenome TaxID=412755 RepID=A0A0F8ZTN3_9ZZZZ
MTIKTTHLNDIFRDRRQLNTDSINRETPCRRKRFRKVNASPWWLKVNYVSQHLHAASNQNRIKPIIKN